MVAIHPPALSRDRSVAFIKVQDIPASGERTFFDAAEDQGGLHWSAQGEGGRERKEELEMGSTALVESPARAENLRGDRRRGAA